MPEDADRREQPGSAHPQAQDPELIVIDDWPEIVPVTEAELRVFEAYFGGFLDEIFGR
ncbi:hypothetical protein [Mycobacterium sp. KBS0706]|uniref:hypothetical protein n=1 Tax=Mycobacterium sp. KBS0706 TaxID=2578109 RepID=UPI00163D6028|nr:hypothetical protein [Mycobacterium sp. KBS0706]